MVSLDLCLPSSKNQHKIIIDLNVRAIIIKLLEKKTVENLCGRESSNKFLGLTPRA